VVLKVHTIDKEYFWYRILFLPAFMPLKDSSGGIYSIQPLRRLYIYYVYILGSELYTSIQYYTVGCIQILHSRRYWPYTVYITLYKTNVGVYTVCICPGGYLRGIYPGFRGVVTIQ
jgi:hypothetical protein